jgi:AraC family transcriptional regulator
MKYWLRVRKDLAVSPIVEGMVWGSSPVYVERYFFRGIERSVRGMAGFGVVVQLGGARVKEGDEGQWRSETLPGQCLLIPARCETHWHYSGPVDFAVFYFPDHVEGVLARLRRLAESSGAPLSFTDPVSSANALALTEELRKGAGADEHFMALLAEVVFEQTYRILTTPSTRHIAPRHAHYGRLNAVLHFIREHLADDLPLELLAGKAGVSVPHFRRLFQESMGITVHKFVLMARIEQARTLLSTTRMPLARIADECGFSSQAHLATAFRNVHAATPREFRETVKQSGKTPG